MKWLMLIPYTGLWLLLALAGLWSSTPTSSAVIPSTGLSQSADSQTPSSGWKVCENFGTGTVAGVPGVYQRFGLCIGKEWKVRTFLLETGNPALPQGTACIRVGEAKYRCGETGLSLCQYEWTHSSPAKPAAVRFPLQPDGLSASRPMSIAAHTTSDWPDSPDSAQTTRPAAPDYIRNSSVLMIAAAILGSGWLFRTRRANPRP